MAKTMRAWEYDRYGKADVLKLRRAAAPTIARGKVLVLVQAAALNPKDGLIRRGVFRLLSGKRFPKRIGCDFAGHVLAVGKGVDGVRSGDSVWGCVNGFRGLQGSLAELLLVPAEQCGLMPAQLAFTDAASIPLAAQTALQALRDRARIRAGDDVLIHGASGGVGVFAIQLAKIFGAHVTTTSSARNLNLCRQLGADQTLDYNVEPRQDANRRYRIIFDVVGNRRFSEARSSLTPDGVYVSTVPSKRLVADMARTLVGHPRARLVVIRSRTKDLDFLATLIARGELRAVIDRIVPFEELSSGLAHLESRRARGKIVVRVAPRSSCDAS